MPGVDACAGMLAALEPSTASLIIEGIAMSVENTGAMAITIIERPVAQAPCITIALEATGVTEMPAMASAVATTIRPSANVTVRSEFTTSS